VRSPEDTSNELNWRTFLKSLDMSEYAYLTKLFDGVKMLCLCYVSILIHSCHSDSSYIVYPTRCSGKEEAGPFLPCLSTSY